MSVALTEIVVGAVAGNIVALTLDAWINYIAGFGAILLTFLAGTEIDPKVVRKHFGASMSIGLMGFFAPYLGCMLFARYRLRLAVAAGADRRHLAVDDLGRGGLCGDDRDRLQPHRDRQDHPRRLLRQRSRHGAGAGPGLRQLQSAGSRCSPSCTVAVARGAAVDRAVASSRMVGNRVSEPEIKFVLLVLFGLGGLANLAKSEAVLPAYLVGMVLAPLFLANRELQNRIRVIAFAFLTPFYFLKAGSLIEAHALIASAGLIALFLGIKMATKFVGILPLTKAFKFDAARGHVHDAADVDGPDLRQHLGAVRPDQPHHRPGAIHDPGDRGDRQRRGADADRADLVPAEFQAARGGCLALGRRLFRHRHARHLVRLERREHLAGEAADLLDDTSPAARRRR